MVNTSNVTAFADENDDENKYFYVDLNLSTFSNENYTGITNKGNIYKNAVKLYIQSNSRVRVGDVDYYGDFANFVICSYCKEDEVIKNSEKRRISWDTAEKVSLAALGENRTVSTNGQVGCGMLYIKRKTAQAPEGQEFFVHNIFSSTGVKDFKSYFEEEGEYKIALFFETYEYNWSGVRKKDYFRHVLTYSFNIRRTDAKISLLDNEQEGNYVQKGFITGSKNISVSFNNNKFISAEIELRDIENNEILQSRSEIKDGYQIIDGNGLYYFYVKNEAFNTEQFSILVNSETPYGTFDNIKRVLDHDEIEVEGWARMEWSSDRFVGMNVGAEVRHGNEPFVAYQGERFDEEGQYTFRIWKGVSSENWTQEVQYTVNVVPMDAPVRNKDILENSYRFNNMVTKWYEVYDFLNDTYYAFSHQGVLGNSDKSFIGNKEINESNFVTFASGFNAFDAAMTFELEQFVTERQLTSLSDFNESSKLAPGESPAVGTYWEYYDRSKGKSEIYFSVQNRTHAMNINAWNNVVLKTWDYRDGDQIKVFEKTLFDSNTYLNRDFIFASKHPTESFELEIKRIGEEGIVLQYDFNTSNGVGYIYMEEVIRTYNLTSGEYEIKETDSIGNSTTYYVYLDLDAPTVELELDGIHEAKKEEIYRTDGSIIIKRFYDNDARSCLCVNGKYYWQDELSDLVLTDAGVYEISAYDRNMNVVEFTIVIEGTLKTNIVGKEENDIAYNDVKIYVTPFITQYQICINEEEIVLPLNEDENGYYYEISQLKNTALSVNVYAFATLRNAAMPAECVSQKNYSFKIDKVGATPAEFHEITVNPSENGQIELYVTSAAEGDSVEVIVKPEDGYRLKEIKMNGNSIGSNNYFVMPGNDVELAASFERQKYYIYLVSQANGTIQVKDSVYEAEAGKSICLICTPNKGYSEDGLIRVNGEVIEGNSFIMPSENVYISVTFPAIPNQIRRISFSVLGEGTISVSPQTNEIMSGTEVNLLIKPAEGYIVKKESLIINGEICEYSNFIMPNEDTNVSIEFIPTRHGISISQLENGNISVLNKKELYEFGDEIILVVTPNIGYGVVQGSLRMNEESLSSSNFYMPNENVIITASFEKLEDGSATFFSWIFM